MIFSGPPAVDYLGYGFPTHHSLSYTLSVPLYDVLVSVLLCLFCKYWITLS